MSNDKLRAIAEQILVLKPNEITESSIKDVQTLVHELSVHQLELEAQNEELKRVHHELEEAKHRFADLFNLAPVAYLILSPNGIIKMANEAARELLCGDRGQLQSKPLMLHVDRSAKDRFVSHLSGVLATRERQRCELLMRSKSGRVFSAHLESTYERKASTGDVEVKVAVVDVDERKVAEDLVKAILESVPDALLVLDAQARIVNINREFVQQFGYTPAEAIGLPLVSIIPPDSRDIHHGHVQGFLAAPAKQLMTERKDVVALHKNGSKFPVSISLNPFRKDDKPLVVATIRNVTDERRLEAAMAESKTHLERALACAEVANRAKSEFLAHMSHEIRTPLSAVLGYADLMRHGDGTNQEKLDLYLGKIEANGRHLLQIINDLLDLSKVENGKIAVETLTIPLVDELRSLIEMFDAAGRQKGLAFEFEIKSPLPEAVKTDPVRLRQILVNLLGNAIKFTKEGKISIGVRLIPPLRDEYLALSGEAPATLEISVTDTGIGIAPEQIPSLFLAFSQGDASTTRTHGGTGLGLCLSRKLAVLLGGDVFLKHSEAGKGSTFVVRISVGALTGVRLIDEENVRHYLGSELRDASSHVLDKSRAARRALEGAKILLADDAADGRALHATMLRHLGASVDSAKDGLEAVHLFERHRSYDLILMDMQMPNLDGLQATQQIRKLGYDKPILALTAHALVDEAEKTRAAGCNDHLTKPIGMDALAKRVTYWLGRGAHQSPPAPNKELT